MLKFSLAINVFISCFLAVEAFAAQESHYQFLKRDCEIQASEGPEGAPQSPPLDVDDPATPGCNKWEINLVVDGDFSQGEKNLELPLLDINYGIGDNLQLKYEIPSVNQQAEDKITTGWGDSKVGIKYLFYENETDDLNFAIYPQLKTIHNEEENGNIATLPLLMGLKIGENKHGKVMMTMNLGYNLTRNLTEQNFISFATGVGTPISSTTSLMGEFSTVQGFKKATEDSDREQLVKANIGMITLLGKKVLLFGSVGSSLLSSDEKQHLFALGGLRWLVGGL